MIDGAGWGTLLGAGLMVAVIIVAAFHGPHDPEAMA